MQISAAPCSNQLLSWAAARWMSLLPYARGRSMRVLPGTGTWTGLQGWARSRVTPKQWALASFRPKPSPLRGWAGWPVCLLILLFPRATGWSRLWSPVGILLLSQPGLQGPGCGRVGPSQMPFITEDVTVPSWVEDWSCRPEAAGLEPE